MIKTGSKDLDEFLQGYKKGIITMIYGPAATGKTTLAKLAAIELAKEGKKSIYIDAESGFSTTRIKQLSGSFDALDKIFVFQVKNLEEQGQKIRLLKSLIEKGDFSLVILDTLGMHYRVEVKKDAYKANKETDQQIRELIDIARKHNIPILLLNQVYSDIEKDIIKAVGGNMVMNWSGSAIELKKNGKRTLRVKKPLPERDMHFNIINEGLLKED